MSQVLLAGVVGSIAYGLNREESDTDWLGMFAVPTIGLHGLHLVVETLTGQPARDLLLEDGAGNSKDVTLHEAAKWCRLALKGNPTVLELVWLPDELYTTITPLGEELIGLRRHLLSARAVRASYLGYATQQFRRLRERGNGTFSADTAQRTAKHARHMARLITQGMALYVSGTMTLRVDNPGWYHAFGEQVAAGELGQAEELMGRAEAFFTDAQSALPDQPDTDVINDWLLRVRREFYR